ncbi:uncharacterized protein OCT59_006087 [Rhizophagus irregularis]|uniref:uncharacterized protein n=1 Tax=Rhizophagus irregularis TaxID=588596 RepID=UPI003326CAC9|nr:hypothetical protein OCT59_006087 [Rhizophagus irregularis]
MYTGILDLKEKDISDVLNLLVASDELLIDELVTFIQNYLIENQIEWLINNYVKIRPIKKVLPKTLFEDILSFYLTEIQPENSLPPRCGKVTIDSIIIKSNHAAILANWTQRNDANARIPKDKYNFDLIYRGSRDGFSITTMRDGKNFKKVKISRVTNGKNAIYESDSRNIALNFGNGDLVINGTNGTCNQKNYESKILDDTNNFSIEEMEIFRFYKN